jgi:hypothetical protein
VSTARLEVWARACIARAELAASLMVQVCDAGEPDVRDHRATAYEYGLHEGRARGAIVALRLADADVRADALEAELDAAASRVKCERVVDEERELDLRAVAEVFEHAAGYTAAGSKVVRG